ncbi:terpene synthase family protein [Saccharopolyspora pogona]|uniref:terpene synthase family protein n=1 Tax=Saccharopolyspora pogona TaxID=333966 RepID=UPI0016895DE6|nr:hypothetical protein [Saccharopolyspora pogona]
MALRFPEFHIPFALDTNPLAEHAEEHGRQFVRRFDLVPTAEAQKHFDESLLGVLVSRACPRADRRTLELATNWMGCNLVLDDLFDETDIGEDPARLRLFCNQILSWLPATGPRADHDDSPFAQAYTELWERTCLLMSPAWRRRYAGHFGEFLDRCVWEAQNRKNGSMPKVDEYLKMRSCAFMPYIDLLELIGYWEIPPDIYETEEFAELNQALSDSVLWMNDLFSCEKEHQFGDVHNLVLVLRSARGIELQEAADLVGEMVQRRINGFATLSDEFLEQRVPEQPDPEVRSALTLHIENMRSWLRGQLHWRYETKRNEHGKIPSSRRPEISEKLRAQPR